MVSNQSDKFVLFLTVQASYTGADLHDYTEANRQSMCKYNSHHRKKHFVLKHFIEDYLYNIIKSYNYIPQFMPTIFYKGINDVDMMHFAVMCVRPQEDKKHGGVFVYNQRLIDITDSMPILLDPNSKTLKRFADDIEGMSHPDLNFMQTFVQSRNVDVYWND
jgi:hypothetical protein